jgi:hypothetical protein
MNVDAFCRLAGLPPTPVEHFRSLLGEACGALVIIEAVDTLALDRGDSPYLSCQVFDRAYMDGCDVIFEVCNLTFDGGLLAALGHLQPSKQRTDSVVRREIKIFCPSVEKIDSEKPIFSASDLRVRPPRTPEDIRRAMSQGRFAEMTAHQAGYDGEISPLQEGPHGPVDEK